MFNFHSLFLSLMYASIINLYQSTSSAMSQRAVTKLSALIDNISNKSAEQQTDNDNDTAILIFGYIRLNESKKMIIPDGIKVVCADFYGRYFNGSSILPTMTQRFDLFKLLISNDSSLNNMNKTKLLYTLTKDGHDGNKFINKLKDKSPYLFLVKSDLTGNIFGGYTKIECSTNIKDDNTAFVFVLKSNDSNQNAEIFPFDQELAQKYSDWPACGYFGGKYKYGGDIILVAFGLSWRIVLETFHPDDSKDVIIPMVHTDLWGYPYNMKKNQATVLGGRHMYVDNEGTPRYDIEQFEVYQLHNPEI